MVLEDVRKALTESLQLAQMFYVFEVEFRTQSCLCILAGSLAQTLNNSLLEAFFRIDLRFQYKNCIHQEEHLARLPRLLILSLAEFVLVAVASLTDIYNSDGIFANDSKLVTFNYHSCILV
ncbi:MAG: hypothetical protein KME32_04010 [Mojavia pulchra JT2-VF2]|uniref:Uncharacterized protein n=1 Tax=Mojavia pulchra JT2-VF2 TaxID=287848 RepID=A0A951PUX8_9NOST|nr:hypothetical protein [Mojavia pulchra JT2-VF2]